jgi:predicted amidohydrolase YtcJ
MKTPLALSAALGLLLLGCRGLEPIARDMAGDAPAADLVLHGGVVYTLDAGRTWAQAIAIRDRSIDYVGPDAGVERHIGHRTRVLDLAGAMVLPGFQDVHIHPVFAGVTLGAVALHELENRQQYLEAIETYVRENPDVEWITGGGWLLSAFPPDGVPDAESLDRISPDRPVVLISGDGHSAWVNTKALEAANITRETPDPPGGRIDRDKKTGEARGGLQEKAMELVTKVVPPLTAEQTESGLARALKILNGYGVTAFQDAWVAVEGNDAFASLEAYRALDERGELSARVVASLWWEAAEGEEQVERLLAARERYRGRNFQASTVKIMQDGVMENYTAAMLEPYIGKGSGVGMPMVEPAALSRYVTRLDREGFQVHFHAIGDAAIRQCLDAVEAAQSANGRRDARHHISHLQLIDPQDIPRFRELGVVANFQPLWAYADEYITQFNLPSLGPERARWIYPIRSVLRSGAVVAFGSDWDVSSPNPFVEMEVAITRLGPDGEGGKPFVPEESIDLHDALAAFTINGAYVNFLEDRTGSIEVGKLADLVVIDRNLFAIPVEEISETRVLLTLLGGEPVYGDLAGL